MKKLLLAFGLILIFQHTWAQQRLSLAWNLPALVMGTVDLRLEKQLSDNTSLQFGGGFRIQNRDSSGESFIAALGRFVGFRNRNAFLSAGLRFFEKSEYEYPYLAVELSGIYYNETILTSQSQITESKGFAVGISTTLGFVINMGKRMSLDMAMQIGYATPREEPLDYYFPGVGYTTFGIEVLSIRGLHMQPIVALKYNLVRNKRDRIRDFE